MLSGKTRISIATALAVIAAAGLLLAYGAAQEAVDRQQEAKAIEFLKQYRPDELERLQRAKREEPMHYAERIRGAFFEASELDELKRLEPVEYAERVRRLEQRAAAVRLAMQMRTAPPAQQEPLRKQLREMLGKIFDERQARLVAELKEIEERLIEVREEVRLHKMSKFAEIQERLAELIGDAEPVHW